MLLKLKSLGFKLFAQSIYGYNLVQFRFSKEVKEGKMVLVVLREKKWGKSYVIWANHIKDNGERDFVKVKNSLMICYFDALIEYLKSLTLIFECLKC